MERSTMPTLSVFLSLMRARANTHTHLEHAVRVLPDHDADGALLPLRALVPVGAAAGGGRRVRPRRPTLPERPLWLQRAGRWALGVRAYGD